MADTSLSPRRLAYLAGVRRQKRRVRIWQLALLIGLFGFWELSCRTGLSDGFLVSCPSRMAATFWSLCRSGQLLHHIGVSCLETVLYAGRLYKRTHNGKAQHSISIIQFIKPLLNQASKIKVHLKAGYVVKAHILKAAIACQSNY